MTAAELANALGLDRSAIVRYLADLGDDVVQLGAVPTERYSLRRTIRKLGHSWPIHRVNESGDLVYIGMLESVCGGFKLAAVPPILRGAFPDGFYEGEPFHFHDAQPDGFLGRLESRRVAAALGVSPDVGEWGMEDVLAYLLIYGEDLPGDLVFGEEMAMRIKNRDITANFGQSSDTIQAEARVEGYSAMADRVSRGEVFGSLVGGDQPKFTARVIHRDGTTCSVIVKFAPLANAAIGGRWADLLLAEFHALSVLREVDVSTPSVEIIDSGDRRFLEVVRFDRTGSRGRRGVISLASVEIGFLQGIIRNWVDAANELERQKLLAADDASRLRRVWCFGTLIENVDMHLGNVSFWWRDEAPLKLAPVYDMLPMAYRPKTGTRMDVREFMPTIGKPEPKSDWDFAVRWALEYWSRVAEDPRFSSEFSMLAAMARMRIRRVV